ncbi:ABC transporter ATP-binding protein [Bacillus sp. T3]|uniref:ABC transporter ATP-binding protein n=1 Tax=Bacillus sp. T3 TaxID=467262 RepID=UPI0029822CA6|nr:ABC transporter ATP-binding protein [Bacillus sp. T3]
MFEEFKKPFQYPRRKVSREIDNVGDNVSGQSGSTGGMNHAHMGNRRKGAKPNDWFNTVKRLWSYLSRKKGLFVLVLLLVIVSTGLGLLGPILVGKAVDGYIVANKTDGLGWLLISLIFVYIFYAASSFLQNYWMIGIAQKTVYTLRVDLFKQLHCLPIYYFDKRQHGEIMSRVTNDIENVSSTLNSSVIQISTSVLMLIGSITVMVWLSPLLTLFTLLVVPLMFAGMKWITNRTGQSFKQQQRNLGELNGFIEETISGQRIVKTFSQERKVIEEFMLRNEKLKVSGFWAQTISGFIPKLMHVLNNLSFAIIAGVGGVLALKGMITIGVIVVFTEYARQFTRPLNDLANQFNTLLSAIAGAERVFEILDEKKETDDEKTSSVEVSTIKGDVLFQNVTFSYEKESDTVSDISFHAQPGEMVALVGPTGAGKTTILNLLARFYDYDGGNLLIDGNELKEIKRASLRSQLGFVLQDSVLFEASIRENIRYGRLEASDVEVEQAARLANAHSFIMKLPDGYDTILKQDGGGISQGQKQLLSIARAILVDPAILILDEATSNIDTITELKIQEALSRLMKGRTSFVIAHRLNTVQKADQILVLDQGTLVEKGNHESLLELRGFYYGLYESQLKGEKAL